MINPAPDFWPIFGPLGPTASPGNGPGSENSAGCTNCKYHSWALCVFGTDHKKIKKTNDKDEAPQGLPSLKIDPPRDRNNGLNLICSTSQAGVRASILYGAPYDVATAALLCTVS